MKTRLHTSNQGYGCQKDSPEMSEDIFEDRRKQPDRRRSKRPDCNLLRRKQMSDRRRVSVGRSKRYWWLQANYISSNSLDSD